MIDNARLEVDYIARKRSVRDRRQTDKGVRRAARSQLKSGSEIISPKKEIYVPEKWMLGSDIKVNRFSNHFGLETIYILTVTE